jgi:hypothetical protein
VIEHRVKVDEDGWLPALALVKGGKSDNVCPPAGGQVDFGDSGRFRRLLCYHTQSFITWAEGLLSPRRFASDLSSYCNQHEDGWGCGRLGVLVRIGSHTHLALPGLVSMYRKEEVLVSSNIISRWQPKL